MNFLPNVNEKRWQCVSTVLMSLHYTRDTGPACDWSVAGELGCDWLGRGLVTYRPRDNITTLISRHNCHEHRCHSAWRGPATLPQTEHSHTHPIFVCLYSLTLSNFCHERYYHQYTKIDITCTMHLSVSWILIVPVTLCFFCCLTLFAFCLVSKVVTELILLSALELLTNICCPQCSWDLLAQNT